MNFSQATGVSLWADILVSTIVCGLFGHLSARAWWWFRVRFKSKKRLARETIRALVPCTCHIMGLEDVANLFGDRHHINCAQRCALEGRSQP